MPRERAVGLPGTEKNDKARGCASATSIMFGLRLDLAETVLLRSKAAVRPEVQ